VTDQCNCKMTGVTMKSLFCVVLAASYALAGDSDSIGSRKAVNSESTALKADEGSGKIFFTGPGYTVNLIPHAIVLGLLGFALIFLYGDSLFGSSTADAVATGYGAPATGYGAPEASYGAPAPSYSAPSPSYSAPSTGYNAANRYYDPYAANAASALGGEPYGQDAVTN